MIEMEWISVKERLPESCQECLITIYMEWHEDMYKDIEYITDKGWFSNSPDTYIWCKDMEDICGFNTDNDWVEGQKKIYVTHWMPMPKPCTDNIDK